MGNTTQSGQDFGIPTVSPLEVGLYNFVAWGLLIIAFSAIFLGFGRNRNS